MIMEHRSKVNLMEFQIIIDTNYVDNIYLHNEITYFYCNYFSSLKIVEII